jgi:hypothetical protein
LHLDGAERMNMMPAPSNLMPAPKPRTHDVTVLVTKKHACARVMGVPPEEFGIERNARSIKDCNYAFHDIVTKTRSQWMEEGYDEEQVNALPEYTGLTGAETLARDTVWEHAQSGYSTTNKAAQYVKVTENYIRIDYEKNGKPKLYQVMTGGEDGPVLRRRKDKKGRYEDAISEFDVIPFAAATPIPVPHRFFGKAIADIIIQTQKEKTALKRGALDNLYLHNNPRVEIPESHVSTNTLDDLLVSRPGNIVRTKMPGGLNWQVVPDITGSVYPMLQYIDSELESKTGLAKQTQGVDANALQNQSATAVAQVFSASQMRIKLIARNLAEGVRDMFALLHGTIRKHGGQAETVRLRNQWIQVDPRQWKTRNDMTINVGLGSGGKAQQFAQMMAIANVQKELIAGGKPHLVGDDGLFNTAAELCKIIGFRNPDRFFNDPSEVDPKTGQLKNPPPPPQQDPKVQIEQIKQQGKQAETAQKAQIDQQKAQLDAMHESVQAQADIEVARIKADLDAKLAVMDAHLKAAGHQQEMMQADHKHVLEVAKAAFSLRQAEQAHQQKLELARQTAQNKSRGDRK